MKKVIATVLCLVLAISLIGCGNPEQKFKSQTYSELSDGTWECEGNHYRYKLEITGRMPNATADSTFVYLSNLENISFEQAWKAAGFSSDTTDYFETKDAVLVEVKTE